MTGDPVGVTVCPVCDCALVLHTHAERLHCRAERTRQLIRGALQELPHLVRDEGLAEVLGVSRQTVHNLRRRGMPSVQVGRARRYDVAECLTWLREHGADGEGGDRVHPG